MAEDRNDFLAAFAIGAILGIGATLLLAPAPSGAKKILHEIEPALRRARKGSRRISNEVREVAREAARRGDRVVDTARDELRRAASRKMKTLRKRLRQR